MAGTETPNHHGSHQRLIWPADDSAPRAKVDAIFVPTNRPVECLKEAAATAHALSCPLVTLHSRGSTAYGAVHDLDPAIDLVAIDVPDPAHLRLPELETSRVLAGTMFEQRSDLSTKRNLALTLSHMLGWDRVVFLDDDIRVPGPDDLRKAAGLLNTHTAVGLRIGGFPDNSVVCHAFRAAGGDQGTFVGGGALAVEIKRNRTFFPNIYNEDWFFVLDAGKGLQSVATVGQVLQEPYDPYRPERARAEEFGDVLAEGTFWLLDQGRSVSDGNLAHWREFLAKREKFIKQVLAMVERRSSIEPAERARMAEALMAALDRLGQITPGLCVDYLKALVIDQEQWQQHVQDVRRQKKRRPEVALQSLARGDEAPLMWCTRRADPRHKPGTARGRRTLVTMVPRWRRAKLSELQAAIPSPPPALVPRVSVVPSASVVPSVSVVPRVLTAARRALRPRQAVAPSHTAHALEAADVALAGKERQAEGDDHGDEGPYQQLHP
jgi:hypothetical protein